MIDRFAPLADLFLSLRTVLPDSRLFPALGGYPPQC